MKLGWYVRTIGKDTYGFYYITSTNGEKVWGTIVWPDEKCVESISLPLMRFLEFGSYGDDLFHFDENLYIGLVKIIFSEYITDEYFLTRIGENIDKILTKD